MSQPGCPVWFRLSEHYYTAETYRVMGDLLGRLPGKQVEAEQAYRRAITVAQEQGARLWELRAAAHLCRFWLAQGAVEKILAAGREVLQNLYAWFTEGFDLPDLQETRQLLDEMKDI